MNVTELKSEGLKKSYKIVVDAAQINLQTEAELKAAGEQVKIPGFRPGFIPMKILQQRYGKAVQSDVLKQVINQSSGEVISKNKLRPALTPQINIEDYKEGGDLTYTMDVEIFPEIPDMSFDKITLERNTFEIDQVEIDDAATRVASRTPNFARAKEGSKAAMGQIVTIDFIGMIDGKPFDGGSATDFQLELGSKQFIDTFEEQLVGAKEGEERTVNVTFPENYHASNFAGKAAVFTVTVKQISDKQAPAVDEEFAKARGFENLAALHEAIRGQLVREYDQLVRSQLKKQLFDKLEDEYDFELPPGMVEMEFNNIWERLKEAKEQGDESVAGKSDDELKEEYRAIAERRVKLGILLAELGSRNKIQVGREELNRAVMQQASMFPGQEKQVFDFYRKHPERIEELRGPILEEKVVDYILGKVSFDDKKVSIKELMESNEEEGTIKKKSSKSSKAKSTSAEGEPKKAKAAKKKTSE